MVIKKYIAKNMNEAMTKIRYELGKDAIIIGHRKIRQEGVKGFFSPKIVEVTAAVESIETVNTSKRDMTDNKDAIENIKKLIESKREIDNSVKKETVSKNSDLSQEVKEMKLMLNEVIKNTTNNQEPNKIEEYLKDLDIAESYIQDIKSKMDIEADLNNQFKNIITEEIKISKEEIKGKVVLVGPTGVGKTTTIAKLAGKLALIEKKKVGLITIDTYRIGAVEQLKTYAEIMNIPFKVVITIKEMEEAVKEMEGLDVILIDTTGRSSKNTMQLSELRAFVEKSVPDEVLLVISSTTKNKDIPMILDGYSSLEYKKLIVTKLDETSTYGGLYTIIRESKKDIQYITTGQNVPDDIKVPEKNEIVKLIVGEDFVC